MGICAISGHIEEPIHKEAADPAVDGFSFSPGENLSRN
jgi:hypothetical protein